MRCQENFLPQTQWLRQKDDSIHIFGRSASHGSPFGLCLQSPYSALAVQKNSCSFNVLSPSNRKPCFRYTAVALSVLNLIISHTRYISQLVYHSVTVCRGWRISIILYSRLKVSKGPSISKPRHCLMEIGSGLVTDFLQILRKQPMEYANCSLIILKEL